MPDEISQAIARAAERRFGRPVIVRSVAPLGGGAHRTMQRIDLEIGGEPRRWVLCRVQPGASGLDPRIEFDLLATMAAIGVPVPAVHFALAPDDGLGDGFVMDLVEGETIARRILADGRFAPGRAVMATQCGEALARIHGIDRARIPRLGAPSDPAPDRRRAGGPVAHAAGPGPAAAAGPGGGGPVAREPSAATASTRAWCTAIFGSATCSSAPRAYGRCSTGSWLRSAIPWRTWGGCAPGHGDGATTTYPLVASARASSCSRPTSRPEVNRSIPAPCAIGRWPAASNGRSAACSRWAGFWTDLSRPWRWRRSAARSASRPTTPSPSSMAGRPLAPLGVAPAQGGTTNQQAPTAEQLTEALASWLAGPMTDSSVGGRRFETRIAANLVRVLGREADLGPAAGEADRIELSSLLDTEGSASALASELALRVRTGDQPLNDRLITAARRLVARQLLIANPTYLSAPGA